MTIKGSRVAHGASSGFLPRKAMGGTVRQAIVGRAVTRSPHVGVVPSSAGQLCHCGRGEDLQALFPELCGDHRAFDEERSEAILAHAARSVSADVIRGLGRAHR